MTVTVGQMSDAFRRFRQAERELHRLASYRNPTPAMKADRAKWSEQLAKAERFLQHGPVA